MVGPEEVAFEPGVFLLLKEKAKSLKTAPEPEMEPKPDSGPPLEPDPTLETGSEAKPTPEAETQTFRISGDVPPEIWNRLGTKVLPKLRSGSELKIGIEFSVTVKSDVAESFQAGLKQILDDLGLANRVRIEPTGGLTP